MKTKKQKQTDPFKQRLKEYMEKFMENEEIYFKILDGLKKKGE